MGLKRTNQAGNVKFLSWRDQLIGIFLLALASGASAQGPAEDWRTIETEHFRVHFPSEAQLWTEHLVSRLEAIRQRVSVEVGYEPETRADVVVMNPLARSNGSALPLLRRPRMVLWTTPPPPDSILGHYRDWGEILAIHEDVHLVHLLRPSRNRWQRLASRLIPVGPIVQKAPRWVIEGYATVLEGQLTGYGRPNSDLRAAILRRKAQLGELPSYEQLDGDERWYGRSMAYLLGSAFLEWLLEREGPESLRHLWHRLSAVRDRDFQSGFAGVFGDSPRKLYNRFSAELTYRALKVEEELKPHLQEGEPWQKLSWNTGPPALSPDGERLALVLRSRDRAPRLVVWSTGDNEKAEERWLKAVAELRERDPLDVPAVRRGPLPKKPIYELPGHHGAAPYTPRFLPDGHSILFVRFEPDAQGVLHPDLFRWIPEQGRVERLTRGADVREADPLPDGRHAVAVRHRHGLSQLVRVDLTTGAVEALTEPSVVEVYAQPRVSPDGRCLAFLSQNGEAWRLIVRDLETGVDQVLETPPRGRVSRPAWSADGQTLFASVGQEGLIDIHAFAVDPSSLASGTTGFAVTRTLGAAFAPAPTVDGTALFFLSLEADGLDLRRLELADIQPALKSDLPRALQPAIPPPAPEAQPEYERADLSTSKSYGVGRQERVFLLGGNLGPSGEAWMIGMRGGDLLGRLNYLAFFGEADGLLEGGSLAAQWRGWPVEIGGRFFVGDERPSGQRSSVEGLGDRLDARRWGAELRAGWQTQARRIRLVFEGGLAAGGLEPLSDSFAGSPTERSPRPEEFDQEQIFFRLRQTSGHRWGEWSLRQVLEVDGQSGQTNGDGWNRQGLLARLAGGRTGYRLGIEFAHREVRGAATDFDRLQLGGVEDPQIPRSFQGGRLYAPALPRGIGIGDEYEKWRLDLRLGSRPLWLFHERHQLRGSGDPMRREIELRGLELQWTLKPMPMIGLPGIEFHLGLAEILDPPFEDDIEGWLRLSFRP